MSIFRVTCRLITTHQNNPIKITSILVKQQELYSSSRWITTNSTGAIEENSLLQKVQYYNNKPQILRNYCSRKEINKMTEQRVVAHDITKNLTLVSNKHLNINLDRNTMKLREPIDAPLVIMFSWMLARKKHLLKYAKIYTDLGFNVLTIELTPWQLLWPTKGSQLVAVDALNFLENNVQFAPLMIHGFSVGGYLWGEMMAIMARDLQRYQPLLDKIYAQIWDSAADITEIPVGVPAAIFPNNRTLQNALRNYVVYHLKTFHDVATVHYLRSSQLFHFTLLKAPALFLVSNNDPVGAVNSNRSVKEDMESAGIKTTWYCWEKSQHVRHYLNHPDEYLSYVFKHLENTNVFETIAAKSKAKL